jgi:predicted dehydrogenase
MSVVTQEASSTKRLNAAELSRPRLGFLGVGWIGRHRLQAVAESGFAEIAAVADASPEAVAEAQKLVPDAAGAGSLAALLEQDLDGVVIATPSALHARQSIAAFERGLAVFCQKPLARTAVETHEIIAAAQKADRLLGIDFSYRHVRGVPEMRQLIRSGELGDVYAADLTFHNAYGPDKPWFYDPALSGGGCVIDLGTHLADLALWMLEFADPANITSRLCREGRPVTDPDREVEDYAVAQWEAAGATVRLACSWRLPAGQDCVIEAIFYGTKGAVALRNVSGSFYDFQVEHWVGTSRRRLAEPPDAWGGRAAVAWAEQLARGTRFDSECEHLVDVAALLDGIYGR